MKTRAAVILLLLAALPLRAAAPRSIDATYTARLTELPRGAKELKVWIPLPTSTPEQRVESVRVNDPDHDWQLMTEPRYGNRYAFTTMTAPASGEFAVDVTFRATRAEVTSSNLPDRSASEAELKHELQATRLVTLSPRVRALAGEVTKGRKGTEDQARAIYDYLLQTMTYDKTKPGWGKGDTERACDIHAGNCTDFHSLFLSLARSKGIPSRFVIGFPLPAGETGDVKGYHCWAEFYVAGKGWVPVDASDASKSSDPKVREYLFGNLDPNRLQFTMGRDLELTPATKEPLNFFVYPYAEADGQVAGVPSVELKFTEVTAK